jgi:hypothetical protein
MTDNSQMHLLNFKDASFDQICDMLNDVCTQLADKHDVPVEQVMLKLIYKTIDKTGAEFKPPMSVEVAFNDGAHAQTFCAMMQLIRKWDKSTNFDFNIMSQVVKKPRGNYGDN